MALPRAFDNVRKTLDAPPKISVYDLMEFKNTMGAETPLLIERERTKQAEAARLPLEVMLAMEQTKRLESEARIAEATASIRVKELELEILRLQLRVQ